MKKSFLGIVSLVVLVSLFTACGAGANASNSNAEVEALKKQVSDLQQQVAQNQQATSTQQVTQNQQVAQQQVAQPIQQNQQLGQQTQQNQQVGQQQFGQQMGNQNVAVSLEEAKKIAVTNAGLDINSVTFVKQMQDWDDGFIKWDVDFVYGDTKYDYDISASNGAILKAERELIAYGNMTPQPINQQAGQQAALGTGVSAGAGAYGGMTGQGIDVEAAKQAAVAHAGFNVANVTFVKQKYDFDDGIAKWEIDFVVNTTKYEYEVNAANGAIVKFQVESIYND